MADSPQVKTVVVTGGAGFVGRYLRAELEQAWPGVKVVSWDLPAVDITKPATYLKQLQALRPDWVVHLAAIASVPLALKEPELVQAVNVEGTRKLLTAVRAEVPDAQVLVVSSAEIYGEAFNEYGRKPVPELPLEQTRPLNPYAVSKKEMEEMVVADFSDICVRVRPFPHFGPGQSLGFVTADFASQVARIEHGEGEPVMLVGNLEAGRDFTDVRDVVRAYRNIMEAGRVGEVYNVASGRAVSVKEVLDVILEAADVDITVMQDPERLRPSDVPLAVGDASRLSTATGWHPERDWRVSLVEVLEWWREDVRK